MIASHIEVGTEKVDEKMQKVELNLEQMARQVLNLFKFKISYDQRDFDPDQRLTIDKAIIQLTKMLGSFNSKLI